MKKNGFLLAVLRLILTTKPLSRFSRSKFGSKKDIEKFLCLKGGGNLTTLLLDLELCGFIDRYLPYQVDTNSNLVRYCISDSYLRFYFKFIAPLSDRIQAGDYNSALARLKQRVLPEMARSLLRAILPQA